MKRNQIFVIELTEANYMYVDSFDKSSRFYYAEYDDNMTIYDIKNVSKYYFVEGTGEFLWLPPNGIYIGVFIQDFADNKIYFKNSLPEINIVNEDNNIFFLEANKEYILDYRRFNKL